MNTTRIREFGPHEGKEYLDYREVSDFIHGDRPRYEVKAVDSLSVQCSDVHSVRRTQNLSIQRVNDAAPPETAQYCE